MPMLNQALQFVLQNLVNLFLIALLLRFICNGCVFHSTIRLPSS